LNYLIVQLESNIENCDLWIVWLFESIN